MSSLITIGELIDKSIEHYRNHAATIFSITLWFFVAIIPTLFGKLIDPPGDAVTIWQWISFVLNAIGTITGALAFIHIMVMLIILVDKQAKEQPTDSKTLSGLALKKDLSFLWVHIINHVTPLVVAAVPFLLAAILLALVFIANNDILTIIGSVSILGLLIASLILLIKVTIEIAFMYYTCVLQGQKGMQSLKASRGLVKGRWGATFARYFVPKILYTFIFVFVFGAIFWCSSVLGLALTQDSPLLAKIISLITILLSTLLNITIIPLLVITDYYLYDSLEKTATTKS